MASRAEQRVSRSLQAVLADLPPGASIADFEQFLEVLDGLEFFVPAILREIYPEWIRESLDGFFPFLARKTGEGEAEIFGLCIIISDQTLTPIHLRLQTSLSGDEVSWLECRLGEKGEHGMVRTPWPAGNATSLIVQALEGRAEAIEWAYKATFGQRRL